MSQAVVERPTESAPSSPHKARQTKGRRWLRWIGFACLAVAAYVCFEAAAIFFTAKAKAEGHADGAIVLGASAWNGNPSKVLASRVDEAVRLYKNGQVSTVIFTGGSAKGDPSSEAEAARQYALSHGLPRSATRVETTSTNTFENLRNAAKIAREANIKSTFLVSDGLHLRRAEVMAADLGLDTRPAPCRSLFKSTGIRIRFASHELGELLKYRLSSPLLPKR